MKSCKVRVVGNDSCALAEYSQCALPNNPDQSAAANAVASLSRRSVQVLVAAAMNEPARSPNRRASHFNGDIPHGARLLRKSPCAHQMLARHWVAIVSEQPPCDDPFQGVQTNRNKPYAPNDHLFAQNRHFCAANSHKLAVRMCSMRHKTFTCSAN